MSILSKGKSSYPFWGESLNLISGLDPLGLQTASEATYGMLLPGLSNLTNRMRYYGFYCWLLKTFNESYEKGNSKVQYQFIRRAELMIALIMQTEYQTTTQITGSAFAGNLLLKEKRSYYDLKEGADKEPGKDVYWKYPSGAFGQYYFGSMSTIGLVAYAKRPDGDQIFVPTTGDDEEKVTGVKLAIAFEESLNQEIIDLFINNIKKHKLEKSDIKALGHYFNVGEVPYPSLEWTLYKQLLLQPDFPWIEKEDDQKYNRKNTIQNILKSENKIYDWQLFVQDCYNNKTSKLNSETKVGWYYYRLNEYWQYACTTMLWAVLKELNLESVEPNKHQFIDNITKKIIRSIGLEEQLDYSSIPVNQMMTLLSEFKGEEEALEDLIQLKKTDHIQGASGALVLILLILKNNQEVLEEISTFARIHGNEREGNVVVNLLELLRHTDKALFEFVSYFIQKKVIDRHHLVALRKMGNSNTSTFKFLIEDQKLRFLAMTEPQFTSPRMNALKNMISDLRLINSKNEIDHSMVKQFLG